MSWNVRDTLLGRTIVAVNPVSADGTEESFTEIIMLELDNGWQVTIYANYDEGGELNFSAVHRDHA